MAHELTHAEASELLGVFALDAVDAVEREAVERHLTVCLLCRTEVSEHVEVAGLLSTGVFGAPPAVWDRIAEELDGTPPPLDLASIHALRPKRADLPMATDGRAEPSNGNGVGAGHGAVGRRAVGSLDERRARRRGAGVRIGALVAAATVAASVIGGLGLKVLEDGRRIDAITAGAHGEQLDRVINAAIADPQVVKVEMRSSDGLLFADAWMLPDGRAYLARTNLPDLSPDRSYQLWAVVGDSRVSVGVLGFAAEQSAFVASGVVDALAITDETAGGVVVSVQQPVVLGKVRQS